MATELSESRDDLHIVAGGPARQDSVGNGLALVTTESVVVHDAARPFATADLVRKVISGLGEADAVVAAMPVDETIKRVDDNGGVVETVDRSSLWRAQTPAAFHTNLLKAAHERARSEGFTGTDESQLIERYGGSVSIVRGQRDNMKVTFPEDIALAQSMMDAR